MPKTDILSSLVDLRNWRTVSFCAIQIALAASLVAAVAAPEPYDRTMAIAALAMFVGTLFALAWYATQTRDQMLDYVRLSDETHRNRVQIEELFAMTDMLQAAEDHDDAGAILEATALRLLPDFGGALYVFNNSRDRLDLAKTWNLCDGFEPMETLLPGNCWALKRGKPHINAPGSQTLCCMHHLNTCATVEVPMMARGQVFGLIMLATASDDAHDMLMTVRRVARALADSMSLALSNIALRETLRTQSLRDPLTGLYNRRYMEDALDRFISLAERNGSSTSVLMIDLDNFKRLNDENGHAKGDAVLRDVAAQMVAALRPSDVVSRYGGEELVVILPGCGLDDAAMKAETIRARIESLTDAHGVSISASIGVATVPDTATSPIDIVPLADAALYLAKQAGKNRVVCSERRPGRDEKQPRLVS